MSTTVLLDVNVLLALAWPNHVHHAAARHWFEGRQDATWATCPVVQSGFIRVSANRKVIPESPGVQGAFEILEQIVALPGHVFWFDDVELASSAFVAPEKILGHGQVTDAHLLALALHNEGKLATFDKGIRSLVPKGIKPAAAIELLKI